MSYYANSHLFLSGSGGEINMAMLDNTGEEILKEHIVPYEQRLVAFLDLQGFRDDVIRNYPAEAIGSLFGEFDCLKRMLEKDADDLQVTIISDSIVVSVSLNKPENLLYFFDACSFFAKPRMGKSFVAIRGGIAYGKLHHKDNIVFGPALVDAYEISEGKHKSDFLHIRMAAETFELIRELPQFGGFSMAVFFPENEEKEYYFFNPWLFHLAASSVWKAPLESETSDEIILRLKEYVVWCVMNMAKHRNSSNKIYSKYEDLLVQTICTFEMIKDVYYPDLTDAAQKTANFYSDAENVIPFARQLEKDLQNQDSF